MPMPLRTHQACRAISAWMKAPCRRQPLFGILFHLFSLFALTFELRAGAAASPKPDAQQNDFFLNFPDGIFLSSRDSYHVFAVNLATTPDQLRCQIESESWTCNVLKTGTKGRVAIVILERRKTEKESPLSAKLQQPNAILTLVAAAEGTNKVARTIIREPESQPRVMQRLDLRILRLDKENDTSSGLNPRASGAQQNKRSQLTPRYTCTQVGGELSRIPKEVEIFWLDDRGRIISRTHDKYLDSTLVPNRSKSIRCMALGQQNSSFQQSGDSSLGTVTYGVSPAYQLSEVFRPKNTSSSGWIIWNGKPVTQAMEFNSLERLPRGVTISCFLGNVQQDRHIKRSVCEPAQVNSNNQTDFQVTIRLDPIEVAALWENAERPTLDRYSPRIINLRVINTGPGPRYFGDRQLLVLRANYAPTFSIRSLDASRIAVSVQDPEKDHLIAAAHESKQKPWQAPINQVWSSWSAPRTALAPRTDLRFEVDLPSTPFCQITASDGVLIATNNCREAEKNTRSPTNESNMQRNDSFSYHESASAVIWSKNPIGPRTSKVINNWAIRFASVAPASMQRIILEPMTHGESIKSGFCIGVSGKCNLVLARNGSIEIRPAQRNQAGLWVFGLDFAEENAQLRMLETFPDPTLPTNNLGTSKELAEALAQKARANLLTKASAKRSGGKEPPETPELNHDNHEIVCVSAPELAQTCRDILSMLVSLDSIFATISFQIRSEIRGSKVILALLTQVPDEMPTEVTGINKPTVNQRTLQNGSGPSILIIGNLDSSDEKQIKLRDERQ